MYLKNKKKLIYIKNIYYINNMNNIIKYYELNNLFVNNLKVNNIISIDNSKIIKLNNITSSNLILNRNDNNNTIITENDNMDINIILSNNIINTKYKILITKNQKSLKISCKNNEDKIIGNYNLYNKSYINNDINEQKKSYFLKSNDNNKIFYIPKSEYGLIEGTIITLEYIDNNIWYLQGNLVGNIVYELNLYEKINELIIYICLERKKIIYVITKTNNTYYFNKHLENNIILFLKNNYSIIKLIDIKTNVELFNNSEVLNNYKIKIKRNEIFSDLNNLNLIDNSFSNLNELFNISNNSYYNIDNNNNIEYRIINNNNEIIIENVFLNILDINSYYGNNIINNIELNTLLFDMYNGFILNETLINSNI